MSYDCYIQLCDVLEDVGVSFEPLPQKNRWHLQQQWRECYAAGMRTPSGKRGARRQDWQVFESPQARCLLDEKALDAYFDCCPDEFFIVPEGNLGQALVCNGKKLPDLSAIPAEFYVFPRDMEWTIVFTHEGPVFSRANWHSA